MEFKQDDWNEELEGYVVEVSTLPVGEYVKLLTIHKEEFRNQVGHTLAIKAQKKVYQVAGAENVLGAKGTFVVVLDDTTDISKDRLVKADRKVLAGFAY